MANAYKKEQNDKKQTKLLAQCKALLGQGPVGKQRAINLYAKSASVTTAQAEVALGLR